MDIVNLRPFKIITFLDLQLFIFLESYPCHHKIAFCAQFFKSDSELFSPCTIFFHVMIVLKLGYGGNNQIWCYHNLCSCPCHVSIHMLVLRAPSRELTLLLSPQNQLGFWTPFHTNSSWYQETLRVSKKKLCIIARALCTGRNKYEDVTLGFLSLYGDLGFKEKCEKTFCRRQRRNFTLLSLSLLYPLNFCCIFLLIFYNRH